MKWHRGVVGDLVRLQRGIDTTQATQRDGSVPVISSGGVTSFTDVAWANGPGVLLGRKGTLGRTYFTPGPYWPHDTTLWVTDFLGNEPRFIYYFFKNLDVRFLDVGSANPTLNRNHLYPVTACWPGVSEQRAIAEVLGALDDKIAANDRITRTLEALLRAEFDAHLSYSGVPERALTELVELNPPGRRLDQEAPYLPMQELPSPGIVLPALPSETPRGGVRFMNGDTLMARITPCLENGKTGYVTGLTTGQVGFGSTEYIVMRSREGFPLPLSYFIATNSTFREEAIRRMVGSSGRQRVNAGDLTEIPFAMTDDLVAIERFGQLADSLISLVRSLECESRTLASLRDTLLPKLMDGSIRVKDVEVL